MATEEYYIDRKTYKHNYYGLAGTALIHGLAFIFLYFTVIYPPDPPLETIGLVPSLGEENMGGPSETPVDNPAATEQYVPISEQTDVAPITSETEESVDLKNQTDKKSPEIKNPQTPKTNKPVLALPQKVDQNALFKKRDKNNGESGMGDGLEPGNQGDPTGDPNGDPDGHGKGDRGNGDSDKGVDGISYDLAGRKMRQLPNIEDNSRSVGKVIVRIVVNRNGEVIKAVPGQVGSNTTETSLLEKAKEGALKTKFSARVDGPEEQYGTMTFVFRYKP